LSGNRNVTGHVQHPDMVTAAGRPTPQSTTAGNFMLIVIIISYRIYTRGGPWAPPVL